MRRTVRLSDERIRQARRITNMLVVEDNTTRIGEVNIFLSSLALSTNDVLHRVPHPAIVGVGP